MVAATSQSLSNQTYNILAQGQQDKFLELNANILCRTQRIFALQDIGTLLASNGVSPLDLAPANPQSADPAVPKLALSHFDNMDFETRHGASVNGHSEVPAQAAYVDKETKSISWKPCSVVGYQEKGNLYEVQWQESKERTWLPR